MKAFVELSAIFLSASLVACAQLGIVAPQSFEQRLAYTYGSVTAVRTSAAQALQAGTISKADAQKVLDLSDQARGLLDSSRMASKGGDMTNAVGQLNLANAVLLELQKYLNARAEKK
jgi:hypothetical protein